MVHAPMMTTIGDEMSPTAAIAALVAQTDATPRRSRRSPLPWFAPAQVLELRWVTGEPVPTGVVISMLHQLAHTKGAFRAIEPVLKLIDRQTSGNVALSLWQGWLQQGAPARQAWCLTLICALADDRLVPLLRRQIDVWCQQLRRTLAAAAVHHLALIGTECALAEVDAIANQFRHRRASVIRQIRTAGRHAFTDAAQRLGLTPDELADRTVPHLGFGMRGERILDYGSRQFTARLVSGNGHLALELYDAKGQRRASLPQPAMHDDPALAAKAQATWKQLRSQVKQVIAQQAQRLERALVSGRSWPVARWRELFLQHPLLRLLAASLIWIVQPAERPADTLLFRPLDDGTLTSVDDAPLALPPQGLVRLAHPIELDAATIDEWTRHLADYEIVQPFPQINRPVFRVAPDQVDSRLWAVSQRTVAPDGFTRRLRQAGWEDETIYYGGCQRAMIWKPGVMPAVEAIAEVEAHFTTTWQVAITRLGFVRAVLLNGAVMHQRTALAGQDERLIALGAVPPLIFSEVAVEVQRLCWED